MFMWVIRDLAQTLAAGVMVALSLRICEQHNMGTYDEFLVIFFAVIGGMILEWSR